MREAADAAPRPRVQRYENGEWRTVHVDQRRMQRETTLQRSDEGARKAAAAGASASSGPVGRKSAASIIETSQLAARRLLEARKLVSSIAKACAGRSISLDDGDRANLFVESLVGHYRPQYGALTAKKLRDALRLGTGRETRGGDAEPPTNEELEGHLPAVIKKTDSLMEEYRKTIDIMKRKRGEERRTAAEAEEKPAGSPGRKRRKVGEGTERRKRRYRRRDPHPPDEYLAALEAYAKERAAGGRPLDVPGDHVAEGGMKLGQWCVALSPSTLILPMRGRFSFTRVLPLSRKRFRQQLARFRCDGLERRRYERLRELGVNFPGRSQVVHGGRVKMIREEEEYLAALRARAAAGESLDVSISYETGDGLKLGQWYVGVWTCSSVLQKCIQTPT